MPQGDRTGPAGEGPRTGRGTGYCSGSDKPGFAGRSGGSRGAGRQFPGQGGRGFRCRFFQTSFNNVGFQSGSTGEDEAACLREQSENLKKSLEDIDARLKELEKNVPQ